MNSSSQIIAPVDAVSSLGTSGAALMEARAPRRHERSITWLHVVVLGALFVALFWTNLERLWRWTNPSSGDPNWGHAVFVPLISLIYLLEHRDRLKRTPVRPSMAGLFFIVAGILLFACGIALSASFSLLSPYLQDLAMLTTLFGCVAAIFGWPMVRVALFPIAYLLCALPWPPFIHDTLTLPLQKLAATLSVHALQLTGMNVEQAGNTIHILNSHGIDRALNVAEACSGMRSLITFIAIGLAVAFISLRPMWQKIVISLAAIPIALLCNIFRIVGEGLLDQYVSRSLSEGFAHSMVGLVLLVPGLAMFLLLGWMLDRFSVQGRAGRKQPEINPEDSHRVQLRPDRRNGPGIQRMYFAVLAILFVSATAMAETSRLLELHFVKMAVPLASPLTRIPADLGPWHQCGGNREISADLERELGATDYTFRTYVDERIAGDAIVEAQLRDPTEAAHLARTVAQAYPQAVVRLAITYYTGTVAAVIHRSEDCNLASGIATAAESEPVIWNLDGHPQPMRIVHLINDSASDNFPHYIAYCYVVNGQPDTEAWRVRSRFLNIFERYAWYAKIEMSTTLADRKESERVLSDLMKYALPEIERCLPSGPGNQSSSPKASDHR